MKKTVALILILMTALLLFADDGRLSSVPTEEESEEMFTYKRPIDDVLYHQQQVELATLSWNFTDYGNSAPKDLGRPSVALVLSGGGAKGVAHIAIIEALEKYGIPIDKVFGTSMGALVGGLYCAGLSPREMKEIVLDNDLMSLFTTFDTSGYKEVLNAFDFNSNNIISLSLGQGIGGVSGLIDDYQVLNFLDQCIGNVPDTLNFDTDLPVRFECNGTDMLDGSEHIFTDGSLILAMRASMSIPLVFEPVVDGENIYMDGGVVSNYIAHRASFEGYDIIIVVTLNGYGKKPLTAENYQSISGVAGSSLSILLKNSSKGELGYADYWFSPDTTDYGTLSFSKVDEILEKGYEDVVARAEVFEDLASRFTEEQKVYKDPERVGEYHTWFEERPQARYTSAEDYRHEDLLGRTRVSLGLYGSGGYMFFLNPDEKSFTQYTRRVLIPTFSARAFVKDLYGTPISLDVRLKNTLGLTTDVSAMMLYRFTKDADERVYGLARIKGQIGSLTCYTDGHEEFRLKKIEADVGADLGVMVTNESNHILQIYASAMNFWSLDNMETYDRMYSFEPGAGLDFVYYPSYKNGFFSMTGGRVDVLGTIGYNTATSQFSYNIGLAGENNFEFSKKASMWIEGTAFSGYGSAYRRNTYLSYGGWDGMPGYSVDIRYSQFIMGGVGFQYNLAKSFAASYVSVVIRGGVRSDYMYGWDAQSFLNNLSPTPFGDCFDGKWDLGISVGFGLSTLVGDVVLGVGFNKDLELALYLELE